MRSPARKSGEVCRFVDVELAKRPPKQLQCVAGQRVGVLWVEAQLDGHSDRTLVKAERDDCGGPLGRR